jgi:hypothetical protein
VLRLALIVTMTVLPLFAGEDNQLPEPSQRVDAKFRLYRTRNIFTFLKLDTSTGQVWQVQWGMKSGERWYAPVNGVPLADGKQNGRFTLVPTTNIFNQLLIDQEDGRVWQVQWAQNKGEALAVPIIVALPDVPGAEKSDAAPPLESPN